MSRMSSSRIYRVELEAYVRESHARAAEDARIVEANRNRCPKCERPDCEGHIGKYGIHVWWSAPLQAFVSIPD